jgi:hypothetical protein
MLVHKYAYGYSQKKKHIAGRGFVDSLSNVFNNIKASAVPALRSIGSYVSNNKDLLAKPLLSAVGSLGAQGLTAGIPAILNHIMKRKQVTVDDPKYKEILQNLTPPVSSSLPPPEAARLLQRPPVTNIFGSGARGQTVTRKRGAGIKKF